MSVSGFVKGELELFDGCPSVVGFVSSNRCGCGYSSTLNPNANGVHIAVQPKTHHAMVVALKQVSKPLRQCAQEETSADRHSS